MLKLHITSSKKIGQPDYGSMGACVALEVELDSSLVNNPDSLRTRVRHLFDLARSAVDDELRGQQAASARTNGHGNGHTQPTQHRSGGRGATDSQLRAIRAIAKRLGLEVDAAARDVVGSDLAELTLPQASQLIDHLKSQQNGGVR